jgi:cobalt-zinc-cadmium efflux system outer membrane protein
MSEMSLRFDRAGGSPPKAHPRNRASRTVLVLALSLAGGAAGEPASRDALSLSDARERARRASPELASAREAVAAAHGRERQAGALPNPSLDYEHEQTSKGGFENREDVLLLSQPLEIDGRRGLRREAARLRKEAAEARLLAAQAQLDFDVSRAYALALAADERASTAARAADAFSSGRRKSQQRYAEGDVSGYARRRLELEAARFAGIRAAAIGESRAARIALAALVAGEEGVVRAARYELSRSRDVVVPPASLEQLRELALGRRPDLRAVELEQQASEVALRLGARERIPLPVLGAGYKSESASDPVETLRLRGFVVGVSVPLPLWDRRGGQLTALRAEARQHDANVRRTRRRVLRELEEARARFETASQQLDVIRPYLGAEAELALRAARAAYEEGEAPLIEWLDAVRAYHEAQTTFATVEADHFVQRAALELAAGGPVE